MAQKNSPISCVVVIDEEMSRSIIEGFVKKTNQISLKRSCSTAEEAQEKLKKGDAELIILDIEMPELNAIDLVKSLEPRPEIVLVTSKKEYALEAVDLDVTDYLLKPIEYERFLTAVERVYDRLQGRQDIDTAPNELLVKVNSRLERIHTDEIRWVESEADYVRIVTDDGEYSVGFNLKVMMKKLPEHDFAKVHRNFIVRLDKIEAIEDNHIQIGDKSIPVGNSYRDTFKNKMG